MYLTMRKYRLRKQHDQLRELVVADLVPLLRASPGFEGYWLLQCSDGDVAGVSMFDTEANANAATDRTKEWVKANIREYVQLPAEAMFGAAVEKLA